VHLSLHTSQIPLDHVETRIPSQAAASFSPLPLDGQISPPFALRLNAALGHFKIETAVLNSWKLATLFLLISSKSEPP